MRLTNIIFTGALGIASTALLAAYIPAAIDGTPFPGAREPERPAAPVRPSSVNNLEGRTPGIVPPQKPAWEHRMDGYAAQANHPATSPEYDRAVEAALQGVGHGIPIDHTTARIPSR